MNAESVCKKAAELVSGARHATHGDSYQNHKNIAALWSAYLDVRITPHQVAMMMALLKAARTKTGNHNQDDYVDMAGYAGVAEEIRSKEETPNQSVIYKANTDYSGILRNSDSQFTSPRG